MELPVDHDRRSRLHVDLINEIDPVHRARIHLQLASLAVGAGQFHEAARHFREALLLEPTLEAARRGLGRLGMEETPVSRGPGGLRRWWARIRSRSRPKGG